MTRFSMNRIVAAGLPLVLIGLCSEPAAAWIHGNSFGGSTMHSFGSTEHTNFWGGSTDHTYGEGTTHTNAYGGSATHYYGGGWSKTGMDGGTAYGDAHYGGAYYRPPGDYAYPGYHPPATVGYYGAGCYNCGGWGTAAAAATGAAVGAAVIGASSANASANAYSSGYAAGVTTGSAYSYTMGAIYNALPPGAVVATVGGTTYYTANGAWFLPSYGANGVYYRMVPSP